MNKQEAIKRLEEIEQDKSELEDETKAANDVSAPKVIPYEEDPDDNLPF